MKFGINWPSGFRGENRCSICSTDDGMAIGIVYTGTFLAFSSGELNAIGFSN